ncbi:MAG: S-layer homology domain-containing protein, partial [Oscillospiraceae bacterium]
FEVEIDRKTENGSEKVMVPVNEQGIAQIYVNLNPPSSGGARKIIAQPDSIVAALGDKPVQITIIFMPATVQNKRVRWETSNAKVATVNEKNQVTFVGVGECILTATSQNKKTATVSVKVTERPPARFPMGSFNEGFSDAYFEVDKDNLFYPNKMMTRGELAVLLAKFYRANVLYTASGKAEFPDMPSDEEIADAVALLASKGILRGTEDGRVCTDEIATRGEIVTMLAQMLALDTTDSGGPYAYKDSGKGQTWAYRYIDAMEKAGLLGGVGDGYFAPERGLTRAEAAAFLARLLDNMGTAGMLSKPPADVPPDHWGYPAILRAITNLTPPEKQADGKGSNQKS